MTKSIANLYKTALQYFIPYQTQWAIEKEHDCFFLYKLKEKEMQQERLTKQLDRL